MAENKRYYWLKLNEKFFEDDTMAWLEEQENGKDYIIFYLKLCLKSLSDDGYLVRYVGERLIPYDVAALSRLTNTSADTVAVAMKIFLDIGLINRLETGEIYMNQINEMIGSETESAKRMRKKRVLDDTKQTKIESPSQCDTDVHFCDTEKEIEKEIDKEIEKRRNKKPSRKKRTYEKSSTEYQLAYLLYQKILENNSEFKKPNLQTWSNDIRLMIEKDDRDPEKIKGMIEWVQNDSFWFKNVLSARKLREKYDQLNANAASDKSLQKNKNKKSSQSKTESYLDEWEG